MSLALLHADTTQSHADILQPLDRSHLLWRCLHACTAAEKLARHNFDSGRAQATLSVGDASAQDDYVPDESVSKSVAHVQRLNSELVTSALATSVRQALAGVLRVHERGNAAAAWTLQIA